MKGYETTVVIEKQRAPMRDEDIFISNTVPKVINFPRYNMKCSGDNVILYNPEYFMKYQVFLYISCYIVEIWIVFLTGNSEVSSVFYRKQTAALIP